MHMVCPCVCFSLFLVHYTLYAVKRLRFDTRDALGLCVMVEGQKVVQAGDAQTWKSKANTENVPMFQAMECIYDWTYTTEYACTITREGQQTETDDTPSSSAPYPSSNSSSSTEEGKEAAVVDLGGAVRHSPACRSTWYGVDALVTPAKEGLPVALLKQKPAILFYTALNLFEDELHDNGISTLDIKMRVMPVCVCVCVCVCV
jgi:hypothetical protein